MASELKDDLQNLLNNITISIQNSKSSSELENIRVNSLGKKGSITLYLKGLKDYDIETKKEIGAYLNDIKSQINKLILDKKNFFKTEHLKEKN
jgi:phenylalanyl-tRNA synthetase alpha chain